MSKNIFTLVLSMICLLMASFAAAEGRKISKASCFVGVSATQRASPLVDLMARDDGRQYFMEVGSLFGPPAGYNRRVITHFGDVVPQIFSNRIVFQDSLRNTLTLPIPDNFSEKQWSGAGVFSGHVFYEPVTGLAYAGSGQGFSVSTKLNCSVSFQK